MKRSLASFPVFRQLSPARVEAIAQSCDWKQIEPSQEIVGHLDTSRKVIFLAEGRARSVIYAASGTVVAFGELLSGAMTGEITAIDGHPRTIGIEAIERCVVATLAHEPFLALVRNEPDFAVAVLAQIARNIRGLTERIVEFSTLPVNGRVQSELLRLAQASGRVAGQTILIPDLPTHADFAARVSTHREAVTREINRLVKLRLIERQDSGLAILDLEGLKALVERANNA